MATRRFLLLGHTNEANMTETIVLEFSCCSECFVVQLFALLTNDDDDDGRKISWLYLYPQAMQKAN